MALRKTLGLAKLWFGNIRGLHTFSLPDLDYDYGALEPAINGEIMQIHHQKHHQTYNTKYNKALEQLTKATDKGDTSTVVKLQSAIKFNDGSLISLLNFGGIFFAALGSILFIPGFYYTRIAYYVYKGYKGVYFSNIPHV